MCCNADCRDLAKPIGALNPKRFQDFIERFREQKVEISPGSFCRSSVDSCITDWHWREASCHHTKCCGPSYPAVLFAGDEQLSECQVSNNTVPGLSSLPVWYAPYAGSSSPTSIDFHRLVVHCNSVPLRRNSCYQSSAFQPCRLNGRRQEAHEACVCPSHCRAMCRVPLLDTRVRGVLPDAQPTSAHASLAERPL